MGSPSSPLITPGSVIQGIDPPRIVELVSEAEEIGKEIRKALRSFHSTIGRTAQELSHLLKENREPLQEFIQNLNSLNKNLEPLIISLKDISERVKKGEGTLGKLLQNQELYEKSIFLVEEGKKTLREIKTLSKKLQNSLQSWDSEIQPTLKSIRRIAERVERGEGSLGKILSSEEFHREVKETLVSTREVSQEAKELIHKVKELKLFLGYEGRFVTSKKPLHMGYLRIEPSPSKYYLIGGGTDMEDDQNLLTIELGRKFMEGRCTVKGGYIERGGGGGVEYRLRNNLSLNTEAFYNKDSSHFHLRSALRWRIWKNIYLEIGGENLLHEPRVFGGIKIEYQDEDLKYLLGTVGMVKR